MADKDDKEKQDDKAPEAEEPKRRRRIRRRKADDAPEPKAEAVEAAPEGAEDAEEEPAEEKPKRRRRAAKPAAEKEPEAAAEEEAEPEAEEAAPDEDEAPADEETPQPVVTRRTRPKTPVAEVKARARYVRTSARKARLVCDHIRGKSVGEARAILDHTPREVARDWKKLLESAVANAEHNHELEGDELRITAAHADEGPTMKRYRPRAMGRATPIHKRTSHLSIVLAPSVVPARAEPGKKSKAKGKKA